MAGGYLPEDSTQTYRQLIEGNYASFIAATKAWSSLPRFIMPPVCCEWMICHNRILHGRQECLPHG
jgi:hypothetical protein